MRFPAIEDDTLGKVRAYLERDPKASANKVFEALGGNRPAVLDAVKTIRSEVVPNSGYHLGITPSGAPGEGGTTGAPFRGPGTTAAPSSPDRYQDAGTTPSQDEVERLALAAEEMGL